TTDGLYRVRVSGGATSGSQGPVGHYRVQFQPKKGANNATTSCTVTALPVSSIAAMFLHTCAVRTNGNTDCWGTNQNGQIGKGDTLGTPSSTKASTTTNLQTVTTGYYHSCGRTAANVAYCWGYNGDGELGDGSNTQRTTPVAVSGGQTFTVLDAGLRFTCGL